MVTFPALKIFGACQERFVRWHRSKFQERDNCRTGVTGLPWAEEEVQGLNDESRGGTGGTNNVEEKFDVAKI